MPNYGKSECQGKGGNVDSHAGIFGFVASLLLTTASFLIIANPDYFSLNMAVITLLMLAGVQFIVQAVSFIHIWHEKGIPWNLVVFFSTISIVFIVIVFSIWIMDHLNYNMMPGHGRITEMQTD